MGCSGEQTRVHHCPSKLTHLLSVQGSQLHPCPAFYATNEWAKPRIQGFRAAGKGLSPGVCVFALPFLTVCIHSPRR